MGFSSCDTQAQKFRFPGSGAGSVAVAHGLGTQHRCGIFLAQEGELFHGAAWEALPKLGTPISTGVL